MYRQVDFTRQALFGRVRSTPMRTVAAGIGVSDVAVAKACGIADVPVPSQWTLATGGNRRTRQPKLPAAPAGTRDRSSSACSAPCRQTLTDPTGRTGAWIPVPGHLKSPHQPVTATLKDAASVAPIAQPGRRATVRAGEAVWHGRCGPSCQPPPLPPADAYRARSRGDTGAAAP